MRVTTEEVKVGDVLEVWWTPKHDTVIGVEPYDGPLACMRGGRVFRFAALPVRGGMTAAPGDVFQKVVPTQEEPR